MDKIAMSHPPPAATQTRSARREGDAATDKSVKVDVYSPSTDAKSNVAEPTKELQRLADEAFADEDLRLSISFDKDIGRFIYRGVDRETGEVKREYPAEEVVKRIAAIREMAGIAFDRKA